MKPAIFRLRFWHRWLGLFAIIPLLIVSLTGVLLVYKKPIINFFVTNQVELPIGYSPQEITDQIGAIERLAAQQNASRVKAPNQQEPYWTITDELGHHRLYAIKTLEQYQSHLWLIDTLVIVRHLHTELLLNKIGQTILLISSGISLLLLISGIWLWWPGRRGFRWRFIKPWPMKLKMMLQFHRHSGIVVAPILIMVLLTAAVMLWQKLITPLLPPLQSNVMEQSQLDINEGLSTQQAMVLAQMQLPQSWPTYIRFPQAELNQYRIRYRLPDEWHPNGRTAIVIDQTSGVMEATPRADRLPWQYRLINQLYPLHSGYGINGLYQALIMLAGLGLTWISITGLFSYLRQFLWRK